MASIEDIYKGSDYAKIATKSKDKTPISEDGGSDILKNETKLEKARGGKLIQTAYSTTVKY